MYITKKADLSEKKRGMIVWGYIIGIMGVINLAMAFSDPLARKTIPVSIAFIVIGAFMILRGRKNNNERVKLINLAKELNIFFLNEENYSIPLAKVASAISMSRDEARDVLKELINQEYITNLYIDNLNSQVILTASKTAQGHPHLQAISVTCPNCGASCTVIQGQKNKCEYCGTILV